jgi:oligoendopeptidase F
MSSVAITRSQVPVEETWSSEDIFATREAWEAEYQAIEVAIAHFRDQVPTLAQGPQQALAVLSAWDDLAGRVGRVAYYANLLYNEETTNPANQAMSGRANLLTAAYTSAVSLLQSTAVQLPAGTIEGWLAQEPGLAEFRLILERIAAARAHALSPDAEAALAAVGPTLATPFSLYNTITSGDMKFETVQDSKGNDVPISLFFYLTQIETSPDTELRRRGYAALTKGLEPYKHGLAGTLSAEIRKNVQLARLRGYESVFDMLLNHDAMGRPADGLSPAVFHQVLDIFVHELAPHMQRYARLRKRVLGLDKLLFSDVKAPLDPEFDPRVSFEQAGEMLCAAVQVLGPEYHATMQRAFSERWVYRGNNEGRGMIAFGGGVHGVHGYSLYPWGGNLFDVFLLGHELGHSCHYDLAMRNQRAVNMATSRLFVEAPSTLTEQLLVQHVRATTDDARLHRWLDMYLMMSFHHNCVTHILEAELLRRLYTMAEAKRPLTTGAISQTKFEILQQFWGDTVELDAGAALTWMRQPHYYIELYPYTYSVGISAATVLAKRIEEGGQAEGERWVEVLKAGGSRSALELFQMAGLDMTSPEPFRQAVAFVGALVDRLEASFA